MHNSTQKETVYSGSALPVNSWAVAEAPAAAATVYSGPAQETVFDETKFQPRKTNNSLAAQKTTSRVRAASMRFFIVAGVALLELMYFGAKGQENLSIASAFVLLVFGILGVYAYRLNKGAFLVGALIYAADTVMVLMAFDILAVVIHAVILYRLYTAYGLICDLEAAQA